MAITLPTAVALSGCTGWKEEITGTLTLKTHVNVRAKNGRLTELSSGPAHVRFAHGITGIRYPRLLIRTPAGISEIRVPREAFKKNQRIEASAAWLRQDFGLRGGKTARVLKSWQTEGNESYDYECGYYMPSGDTMIYISQSCTGHRWARRLNERKLPIFKVELVSASGEVLGDFQSIGAEYEDSTILEQGPVR